MERPRTYIHDPWTRTKMGRLLDGRGLPGGGEQREKFGQLIA